jgi:hypothetical protein
MLAQARDTVRHFQPAGMLTVGAVARRAQTHDAHNGAPLRRQRHTSRAKLLARTTTNIYLRVLNGDERATLRVRMTVRGDQSTTAAKGMLRCVVCCSLGSSLNAGSEVGVERPPIGSV